MRRDCSILAMTAWVWAVGVTTAPTVVHAGPQDLARAIQLYEAGQFTEALAALEQALEEGDNNRAGLAEIYIRLGEMRAGAGDEPGADTAFAALLALDPTASPPEGSSPVVREPFERARQARGNAPALGLKASAPPREVGVGTTVVAVLRVHGDTANLTAGARVRVESGPADGREIELQGDPPFRLVLPGEATAEPGELRYTLELVDRFGSVLASEEQTVRVFSFDPGAPSPDGDTAAAALEGGPDAEREEEGGSFFSSPWFWGGVAAAVVGAGAVVLLTTAGEENPTIGPPEFGRP